MQQQVEEILRELGFDVEELEDDTTQFNFAIKFGARHIHLIGSTDDPTGVFAVSGLRMSDEHWEVISKFTENKQRQFYFRVKELLLLRGVRFAFKAEQDPDLFPRTLQVSSRVDVEELDRSSVHRAISEVIDGGELFINASQGATA